MCVPDDSKRSGNQLYEKAKRRECIGRGEQMAYDHAHTPSSTKGSLPSRTISQLRPNSRQPMGACAASIQLVGMQRVRWIVDARLAHTALSTSATLSTVHSSPYTRPGRPVHVRSAPIVSPCALSPSLFPSPSPSSSLLAYTTLASQRTPTRSPSIASPSSMGSLSSTRQPNAGSAKVSEEAKQSSSTTPGKSRNGMPVL